MSAFDSEAALAAFIRQQIDGHPFGNLIRQLQGVAANLEQWAMGASSASWTAANISAQVTIPHGLSGVPLFVAAFGRAPFNFFADFQESAAADATNIYIKGYVASGAAVTSSQNFYWLACLS